MKQKDFLNTIPEQQTNNEIEARACTDLDNSTEAIIF